MKILCWTETFLPSIGGVELFCASLVKGLQDKGHQIQVMTSHRESGLSGHDSYQKIPVLRLPLYEAMASNDVLRIMKMRTLVERELNAFSPDLIHLNLLGPGAFLFLGKTAEKTPKVVSLHGELKTLRLGGSQSAFGRILDSARWITACSQDVLDQAVALSRRIKTKSSVIYYGVEKPRIVPAPLPFDPPRIATLGRLVKEKGIDIAIDMFALLLPQHPTLELMIGGDGPERRSLEAQVEMLGLQRSVLFAGWVEPSAVPAFLNRSTLLLMPSRVEGLGIVTLEAAWMKRPVVSTLSAGLGEAVLDGITGFNAPKSDPTELAARVQRILQNPSLAEKMGEAGRQRAESRFGWDRCLADFEKLFTTIITEQSYG
jgi:type III pantothenate kinase